MNRLFLMSVILQVDGSHFHSAGTAIGEHVTFRPACHDMTWRRHRAKGVSECRRKRPEDRTPWSFQGFRRTYAESAGLQRETKTMRWWGELRSALVQIIFLCTRRAVRCVATNDATGRTAAAPPHSATQGFP